MEKPFGFVVIDKPSGLTSHDCVNRLRKVFGIKKIGHSGTLDPAVTGVLPIAIGDATRLISYLQGSKAYKGIIQLGTTTNTDDLQGEIIKSRVWPLISENDINTLLESFRGEILQKPPIFSSVHIKGERAYKKARKGEKFNEKEDAEIVAMAEAMQEEGSLALRATGAISDDGIIDPRDTRMVLGLALSASYNAHLENTNFGVFRM